MLSAQVNDTPNGAECLAVVLELSGKCWKIGMNDGKHERPSIYNARQIEANKRLQEVEATIEAQKAKWQLSGACRVVVMYEAGQDGFWICRALSKRGYEALVIDPASIAVERHARRAKTDRLDTLKLLSALQGYLRGERDRMHVVRVPSMEEEDRRHWVRGRGELQKEIQQHRQRISKLLKLVGCWHEVKANFGKLLETGKIVQHDRTPLPQHLKRRLQEEYKRLQQAEEQFAVQERELETQLPQEERERSQALQRLKGIGKVGAVRLLLELFWRRFKNRKEVGSCVGLVPQPYSSGLMHVDQGISKQGNKRVRSLLVEMAWMWLRYQPASGLSRWFAQRTSGNAQNKRAKRIAIVAVARKLAITLWRYLEQGVIPDGAILKVA